MKDLKLRAAQKKDLNLIFNFIKKIAKYEKLEHEVSATRASLKKSLFSKRPYAHVLIAEIDKHPVGYAIFYFNFSSFKGRPGLFLEDLFILPEYRSNGFGLIILKHLAKIAKARRCARMEWVVLNWNTRAISFYRNLGAKLKKEWYITRLDERGLRKLAQ